VQINVMGNINEPFLAGHRFEVAFTASEPPTKSPTFSAASSAHTYSLKLSISG